MPKSMPFNEFMLRVSWSCLTHPDHQTPHVRRGEVMLDLGLPYTRDLSSDEMQEVARAAKMAALKCLRRKV